MTEVEWLTAETPEEMLEVLRHRADERKLRLFAHACFRHGWELFPEQWQREALEIAERYTDGEVDEPTRMVAQNRLGVRLLEEGCDESDEYSEHLGTTLSVLSPRFFVENAAGCSVNIAFAMECNAADRFDGMEQEILAEHAAFVRDIFGNPFRDSPIDPQWRTSAVVAIATAIYADRDFAAMPVLADALEEAGCDAWDVLAHCRGEGTHVRGCWLLDKLLGKG